ncbi:MAG: hypothetical protein PHS85_01810 [Sulfurovum sp.]|nr:hypothetical protein [Sulfurovum sp.]
MKKSLILIGAFAALLMSGCGEKKEQQNYLENLNNWDDCNKVTAALLTDLDAQKIDEATATATQKLIQEKCKEHDPSKKWFGEGFNTNKPTHNVTEGGQLPIE